MLTVGRSRFKPRYNVNVAFGRKYHVAIIKHPTLAHFLDIIDRFDFVHDHVGSTELIESRRTICTSCKNKFPPILGTPVPLVSRQFSVPPSSLDLSHRFFRNMELPRSAALIDRRRLHLSLSIVAVTHLATRARTQAVFECRPPRR